MPLLRSLISFCWLIPLGMEVVAPLARSLAARHSVRCSPVVQKKWCPPPPPLHRAIAPATSERAKGNELLEEEEAADGGYM